jgi:antitoxin (DNA-binding transcriptional repressor) of toxin-antitoxin stability system
MENITSNDTSTLEEEVRNAVEQGHDVQEKVRQLTLRIIRARSFDIKSLRQTTSAVLRGARAGVQKELQHSSAQTGIARDHLKQAVTGLDVALAQFAEAAKLAVEEAAGRAQKYSSEDLKRARADLESLEKMFLETLQSSASGAKDVAGEILHDLAAHSRNHGSAVGAQMKETLSVIARELGAAGRAQVGVGLHLAQNTADLLRQIAAGVLTGLADHVKPGHTNDKGK